MLRLKLTAAKISSMTLRALNLQGVASLVSDENRSCSTGTASRYGAVHDRIRYPDQLFRCTLQSAFSD